MEHAIPSAGRKVASPERAPHDRHLPGQRLVTVLGAFAAGSVALLLVRDVFPGWFPSRAHALLSALPLVLAGLLVLALHIVRRTARGDLQKALGLVAAFLLWAANTLWPHSRLAPTFNDAAIALFAVDIFFVTLAQHPRTHHDLASARLRDLLTGLDREER